MRFVAHEDRAGAAALVLVALRGFVVREQEARSLVAGGGAVVFRLRRLHRRRAGRHDAGASRSACTPDSGDEDGRVKGNADGIVPCGVADVVDLRLPAVAELMLDAEGPLDGVRRMNCVRHHDVLRLREELRLRRSRNLRLREWAGGECARPTTERRRESAPMTKFACW